MPAATLLSAFARVRNRAPDDEDGSLEPLDRSSDRSSDPRSSQPKRPQVQQFPSNQWGTPQLSTHSLIVSG